MRHGLLRRALHNSGSGDGRPARSDSGRQRHSKETGVMFSRDKKERTKLRPTSKSKSTTVMPGDRPMDYKVAGHAKAPEPG